MNSLGWENGAFEMLSNAPPDKKRDRLSGEDEQITGTPRRRPERSFVLTHRFE